VRNAADPQQDVGAAADGPARHTNAADPLLSDLERCLTAARTYDRSMPEQAGATLSLVVIRVRDLTASRSFYELLGLAFTWERYGNGPDHLSTSLGDVVLELYPQGAGGSSAGLRLGLHVPSLSDTVTSVGPTDVKLVERAGERVAVVSDPDGHTIELTERWRRHPNVPSGA
jgi:catechol 2,3-dioxygenase-like lactoylglutathione lyase family enzyme